MLGRSAFLAITGLEVDTSVVQVPVADADFAAVQKWKVPLLQKAAKRLCTDPHFQFMRVELFKFRRENAWVEARRPLHMSLEPLKAVLRIALVQVGLYKRPKHVFPRKGRGSTNRTRHPAATVSARLTSLHRCLPGRTAPCSTR